MYCKKSGSGKAVVYLHGWGCDGSIFQPVASRLDCYSNYLIDFAGFGNSPPPPESGATVLDYANDIRQFCEQQHLTSVTLVGHSFGCRVAMVLAATAPQLVSRMLLVAPAGIRQPSFRRWCKVARYKAVKFLAKLHLAQVPCDAGSDDYRNCSVAMKNTFVKVVNQDLSAFAKRVTCPVLIVNGTDDTATPLTHAKRLHRLIKHSQLVEINGGHFAFFNSPAAFATTIQNFVE